MEETGVLVATMFIMKSGRQLSAQLHHDGRHTCQFQPKQLIRLYCPYGPRFPLAAVRMASSTSRFAAVIAWDGIEDDSEPLGSGRLFLGCSNLSKAIFTIDFIL